MKLYLKTWFSNFKNNQPSNAVQKINILFTIFFAIVTAVLALMTYLQKLDIIGMSDLLHKQDSIIRQNQHLIVGTDSMQKRFAEEIEAIKYQTHSNQITS